MAAQALEELNVVDLSRNISGPYCTKLLADYGADVIKVEPPDGGDPARHVGPFPGGKPDIEASGLFFYLNNNKKSVTIDLKKEAGSDELKSLIENADVLIENFEPGVMASLGLDFKSLQTINPSLVMTSISSFGQTGPYRDYKAAEIVLQALGHWIFYRGDYRRDPVMAAPQLQISGFISGSFAASATMSAVLHQKKTGIGQHVDISRLETIILMTPYHWSAAQFPLSVIPPIRFMFTPGIEKCKDGYVGLNVLTGQHWIDLCGMCKMYDWAEDENYSLMTNRSLRADEVRDRLRPWLMARTRSEIVKEAADWRVPAVMINTNEDIFKFDAHREREYLVEIDHPVMGKVTQPGAPARMSETPWRIKTPAPLLGSHNEEILSGIKKKSVKKGQSVDIKQQVTDQAKLPLDGIRICDLTRFLAGPFCTSYMGGLGAEVIKVESIQSVDGFRWPQQRADRWWEGSAQWNSVNLNKYDITLDLNSDRGMQLLKEIIKKSDVIIDNFPPRVMDNFNLTYSVVKELKEDIIMVSMPAFGLTGPMKNSQGFAFTFEQASGLANITGYPDTGPTNLGGAADSMVGIHAVFVLQAALEYRNRTGKGQFIEISQLEALTSYMGPAVVDYSMNRNVWGRQGNLHPEMSPHNVYPCAGNDTWVAIAVQSDSEWRTFCEVAEKPEWKQEARFSTTENRIANRTELDELIREWTVRFDPYEIMNMLQGKGIAAGALTRAETIINDPHLKEREFFIELDRDVVDRNTYSTFPIKFSEIPFKYRAAPTLGEHNRYVLEDVLGLSEEDVDKLEAEKIIGTEPLQTGLGL